MTFQPSHHSFLHPGYGLLLLQNPKQSSASCDKADADHKKYLKKMWDTSVFDRKRKEYEKKANAAAKASKACKKAGVGGREKGYPGLSIPKLWQTDPKKRPVEAGLVVSSAAIGPDALDIITAAVKGWHPTIAIALEWRGEIAAGLLTLQALGTEGYESLDTQGLQKLVALTLGAKGNAKLLKMANEPGDNDKALEAAAKRMRAKIAKLGDTAMTYAFGMRGLLMSTAATLASAAQYTVRGGVWTGLAIAGAGTFGITAAIAAIGAGIDAAHSSASNAIASAAKSRMEALVRDSTAQLQAEAQERAAEEELKAVKAIAAVKKQQAAALEALSSKNTIASTSSTPPSLSSRTLLWAGATAVALLGVVVVVRSRSNA